MEEVKELGQIQEGSIHCISIIGQIEGHQILPDDVKSTKYEHILPTLAAVEESFKKNYNKKIYILRCKLLEIIA